MTYSIHNPSPLSRYNYTKAEYVDPHPGLLGGHTVSETNCSRCGGAGLMPYSVDHGKCWGECGGRANWTRPVTADEVRKAAKDDVARINRTRRAEAKAKHYLDQFIEQAKAAGYPQWQRALEVQEEGGFLNSLLARVEAGRQLSDRQVVTGAESIDRYLNRHKVQAEREAARAQREPLEEGRRVITGQVVSTKFQNSQYGGAFKMLLELPTGQRVWGTIPSSLMGEDHDAPAPGTQVQLTATVTRSDDDHTFGFYSRPAKATRLAQ